MGYLMRDAFVKFEECQTAWLHEREFVEVARALKILATDMGKDTQPVMDALARYGAKAAFAVLHRSEGHRVSDAQVRTRVH